MDPSPRSSIYLVNIMGGNVTYGVGRGATGKIYILNITMKEVHRLEEDRLHRGVWVLEEGRGDSQGISSRPGSMAFSVFGPLLTSL